MKDLQNIKNIKVIASIIVILIVGFALYSSNKNKTTTNTSTSQENTSTSKTPVSSINTSLNAKQPTAGTVLLASKCGFKITYPAPGASVSFPLTIKGTIDHTDAQKNMGCTWNEIQGRAGSAQLFYNFNNSGWKSQSIPVPIITSGTQVASTSAFSVSLNFLNQGVGLPSGSKMKITFLENEVGITNPKTFDFYVYFK